MMMWINSFADIRYDAHKNCGSGTGRMREKNCWFGRMRKKLRIRFGSFPKKCGPDPLSCADLIADTDLVWVAPNWDRTQDHSQPCPENITLSWSWILRIEIILRYPNLDLFSWDPSWIRTCTVPGGTFMVLIGLETLFKLICPYAGRCDIITFKRNTLRK